MRPNSRSLGEEQQSGSLSARQDERLRAEAEGEARGKEEEEHDGSRPVPLQRAGGALSLRRGWGLGGRADGGIWNGSSGTGSPNVTGSSGRIHQESVGARDFLPSFCEFGTIPGHHHHRLRTQWVLGLGFLRPPQAAAIPRDARAGRKIRSARTSP